MNSESGQVKENVRNTDSVEKGVSAGSAIIVDSLSLTFDNPQQTKSLEVLDDVSIKVPHGQILCIIGPSGCGKSTLLNTLAGLLTAKGSAHTTSVDGVVKVLGEHPTPQDRRIGYLFQQDTLLPWMVAWSNVALPLRLFGMSKSEAKEKALSLLNLAGLSGFADHYPKDLSGGMRKRIQLLQVIAQDPDVLLMDEPFGALDAQTKAIMQQEFLKLWERDRKTIVFVTHDLNEAILLGDRVLCMSARPGRIRIEVEVPLERPRTLDSVTTDPRFGRLFSELWSAVEEEANRALSQQ